MASLKFNCVQWGLSRLFAMYGKFLARHPTPVLILSLVVAFGLSTGIFSLKFYADTEYLFTPDNSRARQEKEIISREFPVDFDMALPNRVTEMYQRMVILIVVAKDNGNVLREECLMDILDMDENLRRTTAVDELGHRFNYSTVCARFSGNCIQSPVIKYFETVQGEETLQFPYPIASLPSGEVLFLESSVGGVTVEEHYLMSAKAIQIVYLLRHSPSSMNARSGLWEDAVHLSFSGYETDQIVARMYTSDAIDEAQKQLTISVLPFMSLTFGLLITFAVVSCMMADWVLSKPWMGTLGVVSAFLAISTTLGLLSYCGVLFNQIAASMPFLILGIGLDDMFIMLAAWRQTDPSLSVEERMGHTYADAAVSITITSVTDFLAFCIGAITPLPAVRIFCLFTGVAVFVDYLFQITFFGACMVYIGHREAGNKHCYTCKKVVPKEKAPSKFYKIMCAGGNSDSDSEMTKASEKHICMIFFRKYFGPFITSVPVMILVLVIYVCYIGGAIYGCITIKEGLELENLAETGSETNQFFTLSEEYFSEDGPPVSVMFLEPLEYWDPGEQKRIDAFVKDMETSEYAVGGRNYTEFWLFDFLNFTSKIGMPVMDKDTFLSVLKDQFLKHGYYKKFKQDINFSEDGIESSRLVLATGKLESIHESTSLMFDMRQRADENHAGWHVEVFASSFIIYEQFVIVLPNTLQNLLIAVMCMMFVALLFIPHPGVAILVTLCVVSIETGVIGYMSHLDISLDGISMINIILCIGFSIDFSAHICYAYVTQHASFSPRDKAAMALETLGYPILQGALSTMVGIVCLLFTNSYIFHVFAKILLLVMAFGMFHGIVILPVILNLTSCICCWKEKTGSVSSVRANGHVKAEGKVSEPLFIQALSTSPETTL